MYSVLQNNKTEYLLLYSFQNKGKVGEHLTIASR